MLKSDHNLILTGAPGTGKTYLAQRIAEKMEAETRFVQFHPSYDYTDFVEGLRPKNDANGNIGFERRDGVFKAFCKKALQNFLDSKKSEEEIIHNEKLKKAFNKLADDIEDGNVTSFPLKGKGQIDVVGMANAECIILKNSDTGAAYRVYLRQLELLSSEYRNEEELKNATSSKVKNVTKAFHAPSCWAVLNYLYKNIDDVSISPQKEIEEGKIKEKPFVFIIDEINRGDISKIMGELFFSIDPGYRGEKGRVQTQYQNLIDKGNDIYDEGFFVPENVYIIGTMNDIDRSVESMDFAMRRRFAWKEITAESQKDMLDNLEKEGVDKKVVEEAKRRMKSLNEEIGKKDNEYGLSSAYHIGPAYFLKLKMYKDEGNGAWNSLWNNHIKGLLREYLRGKEDIDKLMADLRKAYDLNNQEVPDSGDNEDKENGERTENDEQKSVG